MTALYIILGIAVLILLLLMLRIRITVFYNTCAENGSEFAFYLGIGPVKLKLFPKKKKKVRLSDFSAKKYRRRLKSDEAKALKKKPEKKKEKKKDKNKNTLLPGGIGEIFELVLETVEKFKGKMTCEVLRLRISVAAKDAASTALTYSAVSNSAMFLIEAIDRYTKLRLRSPRDVSVTADFESNSLSCDIGIKLSVRIISILNAGWGFVRNYFRTLIRLDNQNK